MRIAGYRIEWKGPFWILMTGVCITFWIFLVIQAQEALEVLRWSLKNQ